MAAKTRKTRKHSQKSWLIFIDTNILLDFYRLGEASAKRTLATLRKHQDSLITTDQVWMEFLKNRQKVIVEAIAKLPKPAAYSLPSAVSFYKPAKAFASHQKRSIDLHKKVVALIEKILVDPARYDSVYRELSKIFRRTSDCNLQRPSKRRYEIRRLARKRFSLGYPPRKDDTLRFGDAINWEWVIACAKESSLKPNVVIVSRDGDYGLIRGQDTFLNDWLKLEFKERVSRQRRVELTTKLSSAFKKIDVKVARTDVVEENRVVGENALNEKTRFQVVMPSGVSRNIAWEEFLKQTFRVHERGDDENASDK